MNCKQCQEKIVEALYDELAQESRQEFDSHIASCEKCAFQFKRMQETLNTMHCRIRIEPDDALLEAQWESLQRKIESEQSQFKQIPLEKKFILHPTRIPAWAYGLAAMFLIIVGIYIGRTLWTTKTASDQSNAHLTVLPKATKHDSSTAQALAYLGRSKTLLLGVMNADDNDYSDITLSKQQQISRQLVQQASYLINALDKPEQQQLKQLIHDLEIILMQLANIEVQPGVPAVEMVKRGVDQKSILFKINVEEIRSAVRETTSDKTENNKL